MLALKLDKKMIILDLDIFGIIIFCYNDMNTPIRKVKREELPVFINKSLLFYRSIYK